jgi:hypothetical protein
MVLVECLFTLSIKPFGPTLWHVTDNERVVKSEEIKEPRIEFSTGNKSLVRDGCCTFAEYGFGRWINVALWCMRFLQYLCFV